MVRAPFRRVRETRRKLNAKVLTRPTRMLSMPPRDGDFLMESGRHLVPEEAADRHRKSCQIGPAQVQLRECTPIVRWSAIHGRVLPRRQPSPDTSSK